MPTGLEEYALFGGAIRTGMENLPLLLSGFRDRVTIIPVPRQPRIHQRN